jgi:hypothetical protein
VAQKPIPLSAGIIADMKPGEERSDAGFPGFACAAHRRRACSSTATALKTVR